MKSFSIFLFIILLLYIIYNFSFTYFLNKKTNNTIKYIILPDTYIDYYNVKSLKTLYYDMFNSTPKTSFYNPIVMDTP